MYRDVTRSSTPWIGGAPPEGQTCKEACMLASRQVHYNWRCEGRNPRYLVLIEETTAITGCAPVTDATGKVTRDAGTAARKRQRSPEGEECCWDRMAAYRGGSP